MVKTSIKVLPLNDKDQHPSEDEHNGPRTTIKDASSWLLAALTISGVPTVRKRGWKGIPLLVYTLLIIGLNLFSIWKFIKTILHTEEKSLTSAEFVLSLVSTSWILLVLINTLILIVANFKGTLNSFLDEIEKFAAPGSKLRTPSFTRRIRLTICMVLCFPAANAALFAVLGYQGGEIFNSLILYPFNDEFTLGTFALFIAVSVGALPWCLALHLNLYIIYCLKCVYREHRESLETIIEQNELNLSNVERSRKHFNKLCKTVAIADEICGPLNGANCSLNTVLMLMLLYNLTYMDVSSMRKEESIAVLFGCCFWTAVAFVYLAIPTLFGVFLNNEIHSCAEILHDCDLASDQGQVIETQVLIYLNRINSEPIGLSVMYMFVLDKSAILSVIGLVATYFILLIQFGLTPTCTPGADLNSCVKICNISFNNSVK